MRLLPAVGRLTAAIAATVVVAGCGEERKVAADPATSTPRVAMTVTHPGYAPFALITYRDRAGRSCHGIGTLTGRGPRVMGAASTSLAEALSTRGKCLRASDSDVSLQVRQARPGAPRVVGGLARAGVMRVVVAGQRVRPRSGGAFLVIQPAGTGPVGSSVELEYRAGHSRRLPLRRVSS